MNTRFLKHRASTPLTIGLLVLVLAGALVFAACQAPGQVQSPTLYYCPMHPDYVSDRPGDCPICGMRLVPMEKTEARGSEGPSVRSPKPTTTAPGQAKPVEQGQAKATDMPGMPGMPASPAPPSGGHEHQATGTPAGLAPVHADAEQLRLAGVRTVAASTGTLTGTIRAVGTVVTPETGVRQVTTKVAGWIEKLYVNSTGRPVRAGEPLFDLYSPELVASQEEYLHARQVATELAGSTVPEVQRGAQELVATAKRRLELFDVPAEFLAELDQSGKAQRPVTFRAPFSGYVVDKTVVEGQRVEPGMNLMTIADLSRAWVTAQLYEAEAGAAQAGRVARVSLPYDDTVKLAGRIDLVYPTLETESRTIKVRLQFPNPGLALKPGMFVNVELEAQRAQGVIVPDSALIDTGTRQVVFVQTQPGHFEPRDVQAGLRSDGKVVLRSGVKAGEQVAVAASFLLDSESRLRGAVK